LNRIKKFLKGWGDSLKGHAKKYRISLQNELADLEALEEEGSLPTISLERKTFIQSELLRLNEEEELYWHQISNENWLLKGDSNTDYFHRKANGKKGKILSFTWKKMGTLLRKKKRYLTMQLNITRISLDPLKVLPFP
jgi:hypothetical protein